MSVIAKRFEVVTSGRDEYPGDGLRLRMVSGRGDELNKDFLVAMGVNDVQVGDEIEITARIVSRIVTRRESTE